ncbi:314_t:CDS:2 [Cetraspora pellucida]|uniref:314_t:CDS:1 n=1 Tax=Cetraspora pellucida TaxID=1433469 RepID=A0A9N9H517_9GLOM|nr:314_t:CDS:2 [Cetraspora pellucida]
MHHVLSGERETPVEGSPADFVNLYCDAWNDDPNLRPDITAILIELDCIRLSENLKYYKGYLLDMR